MAINANSERQAIDQILLAQDIPIEWLVIVDDVMAWCIQNHVTENNPFRAAKVFYSPDRCFIVLAEEQTDSMIAGTKALLLNLGMESSLSMLHNDRTYLQHLVLHEVAAFKLQTSDQYKRSAWAFEMLKRITDFG